MITEKIARIRQLDKDLIPEAQEDAKRFLAIATACTPNYENDGTQHSSSNSKEEAMLNYAQANELINQLIDELVNLKLEVIKSVSLIKDDKQRRFAKLYYVDQKKQGEIAHLSHYALQTVKNNLCQVNKVLLSTDIAIELSTKV